MIFFFWIGMWYCIRLLDTKCKVKEIIALGKRDIMCTRGVLVSKLDMKVMKYKMEAPKMRNVEVFRDER